ncbi:MAG: hypothetical protein SGJ05_02220 [bacterium]|nr:hypothetical protein [bacterium]
MKTCILLFILLHSAGILHATETPPPSPIDTVWSVGLDRISGFGHPVDVEFSEDM